MGVKIDLRGDGGGSKAPIAEGKWDAVVTKWVKGNSSKKETPYVQPIFKITEEAEDVDGNAYKRPVYGENFYITAAAVWRLKNFVSDAGLQLSGDEFEGETFDEIAEILAEELTELFKDSDFVITTELEDSWDGTKQYARVSGIQ